MFDLLVKSQNTICNHESTKLAVSRKVFDLEPLSGLYQTPEERKKKGRERETELEREKKREEKETHLDIPFSPRNLSHFQLILARALIGVH